MSASEKLKALDAATPLEKYEIDLFRPLPQIIAVVEAAEKGVRWESVTSAIGVQDARQLYAALAALDEALS